MEWTFTEEDEKLMHYLSTIVFGSFLDDDLLALYGSNILDRPLAVLNYKVNKLLGQVESPNDEFDKLKLFMHEGHDSQLKILTKFLKPSNLDNLHTYYASQLVFELLYSEECIKSKEKSEKCFAVQILLNAKPLEFEGACRDPKLCTYTEFRANIDKIWFRDISGWEYF